VLRLPAKARFGVYLAYIYYHALLTKISGMQAATLLQKRVRISDTEKATLLLGSYLRHRLNLI